MQNGKSYKCNKLLWRISYYPGTKKVICIYENVKFSIDIEKVYHSHIQKDQKFLVISTF